MCFEQKYWFLLSLNLFLNFRFSASSILKHPINHKHTLILHKRPSHLHFPISHWHLSISPCYKIYSDIITVHLCIDNIYIYFFTSSSLICCCYIHKAGSPLAGRGSGRRGALPTGQTGFGVWSVWFVLGTAAKVVIHLKYRQNYITHL